MSSELMPCKQALGAIKSALSLFTSPFSRSPSTLPTHNAIEVDQRSESGSEDNWDGEAPAAMKGQDVFSLAAAAGRSGEDFEERQIAWRGKGEVRGGKREVARRELQVSTSNDLAWAKYCSLLRPRPPLEFAVINRSLPIRQSSPVTSTRTVRLLSQTFLILSEHFQPLWFLHLVFSALLQAKTRPFLPLQSPNQLLHPLFLFHRAFRSLHHS